MAISWTVLTGAKSTAGSIANWLNRSDLPTENILLEAEALIYERLRVREMMAQSTLTFSSGGSTAALPSDFLDPIQYLPYEYGYPLPFYHEETLRATRDENGNLFSGTPSRWSILGTTAYVDVNCSANFSGQLMYYARPESLSVTNTTNWLTTRYPSLLRYACMLKGYEHMKDDKRAAQYLAVSEKEIADAMRTNEMFRRTQHVPAY